MATANKALKKRAQAFADAHDLPYLKALKAVDEPFHGLRDLTAPYTDSRPQSGARYFRLVKAPGSYASPYDASSYLEKKQHPIFQRLSAGVSRFRGRSEFLRTMGLRTGLIEDCGAEDIWDYRALHRAGLLQADTPVLEPFFHHHEHGLEHGFDALRPEGRKLGVYELNFSSYLWVEKAGASYPLTLQELDGLLAGELSAAEIQAPLSGQDRVWRKSYRYRAVSKNRSPKADSSRGETQPVLQLFLEQDPRKVRYDLPEGLHWNAFDLEGIEFSRFEFLDSELSNRRNGLRLLRDGRVEQVSAHEAVLVLEAAEDQSREKIEIPLNVDDTAFYSRQDRGVTDIEVTEKPDETGKDFASILTQTELSPPAPGFDPRDPGAFYKLQEANLMELIGDLLDPLTKTEREFALPVVKDLVSERRGTIRELVTALRSSMNENRRALGDRLESELYQLQNCIDNYGMSEGNRAIKAKIDALNGTSNQGKPYKVNVPEIPQSIASEEAEEDSGLLGLLKFSAEELDEAREEIAAAEEKERRRELIVQLADELGVITMADVRDARGTIAKEVDRYYRDTPANHLLTAVIRGLRVDPFSERRGIGAELITKLASVQGGPKEDNIAELVRAIGLPSKEFRSWKDTRVLGEDLVFFVPAESKDENEDLSESEGTWDKPLDDLIEENYR